MRPVAITIRAVTGLHRGPNPGAPQDPGLSQTPAPGAGLSPAPRSKVRVWIKYLGGVRHRGIPGPGNDWPSYLAEFHRRRPGITEDVLLSARSEGIGDPYEWVSAAVSGGPVLDLACGSGAMWGRVPTAHPWIGVDRSASELARATGRGADRVIRADAAGLPFPDATFATVVCSLAIMVIQPVTAALAEMARVLVPGGVVVLLVPCRGPLLRRDRQRYARLLLTVRRARLAYPNDAVIRRLGWVAAAHGFEIVVDSSRRFALPLLDARTTRRLVDGLYLPGVPPDRLRAAKTRAAAWEGSDIGIPLRRVVLRQVVREG